MSRWRSGLIARLVSTAAMLIGMPHAASLAASPPGSAAAGTVTVTAYLREGPGTDYRPVDEAPAGAEIAVAGCRDGWCHVAMGRLEGFLPERALGRLPPLRIGEPQACFVNRESGFGGGRDVTFCHADGAVR